ncbi:hypothetical protein [Microbacterium sp. A1-JK]|uniref:hypothetical protein n=1 Tax=Microbacterium sp. A1-JK TaxID=3177516 RepID=UPI0038887D14
MKSAAADGYTNLALTFLAVDECEGYLESLAGLTLDAWVHTLEGARDALSFASAAESAYRSLEVEERARTIERVRCPQCHQLTITGNNTREVRGRTVVECQHCAYILDEIKSDVTRWVGSEPCEIGGHAECVGVHCQCDCHSLGSLSQTTGVAALWDADLHIKVPQSAPRTEWLIIDGQLALSPTAAERKTA